MTDEIISLSRKARRAIKSGNFDPRLDDTAKMILLIVAMTHDGRMSRQNATEIAISLLDATGGNAEVAIEMIRQGKATLEIGN